MFIPFISATRSSGLYRRKGGGGGGRGGGGGGRSGGGRSGGGSGSGGGGGGRGSGGESGESSGGTGSGRGGRGSSSSGSWSATPYGSGGGRVTTIPAGKPFAGRPQGGGTRGQVFGSPSYGSGYPGYSGKGVFGRPFPFFFWPVVWGSSAGSEGYLRGDEEYGAPSNTSRPGGPMQETAFTSSTKNTTFRVLADNATVMALITAIDANCSSSLSSQSPAVPLPYNDTDPTSAKPEQAIEYYRASSVVLTLDGYNNTATFTNDSRVSDTPLPTNIDTTLLVCLNQTIGQAVPLSDAASVRFAVPSAGLIGLFWVFWAILSWIF